MISDFLNYAEENNVFIGHTGVLIETRDKYLFVEKYGPELPYQVSDFKNKAEVKSYLMDRLDNDTYNRNKSKSIIMENN